jgi:hypothetical protein
LVKAALTDEDRRNLKILAEEVPKLRLLFEGFLETLEILSDTALVKSIRASEKDVQEGRVLRFKELLKELGFDEKEI